MLDRIKLHPGVIFCTAIIISVIFYQNVYAQNDSGIKLHNKTDSVKTIQKRIFNPFLFPQLSRQYSPSINYNDEDFNLMQAKPEDAWGISMARLRQSTFFLNDNSNDIKADLYMSNFLFKEKGLMSDVRYILGLASMSAAGYFAYKHIQKYGFLKDKSK